jgi:hypothetical protein
MRKLLFVLVLLLVPASLFAQDWRRGYGYRPYADNFFEISPYVGYRYGGTIYANQTTLFNQNVDINSAVNVGVNFAIPIQNGWKIEFLADRQNTQFNGGGGGLFSPNNNLGDFDITYFQGGVLIPFAQTRSATPYFALDAGVANLDPRVSGATSSTRFAAGGAIGVKVPINRNLGIKIEERGFFTSLSNSNNNCRGCFYTYNHDLYQGETIVGVFFWF